MVTAMKVLLVEDEAITMMALKMELSQAGFHVIGCVASGEETLSAIAQERPDVILMDMRLTGPLSGIETAAKIREADPIPIVFMTGYPEATLIERISQMGAAEYVLKPATMDALKAAIESVLKSG